MSTRYDISIDDELKIKYFKSGELYRFYVKRGSKTLCFSHPYSSMMDVYRAAFDFYEHLSVARLYIEYGKFVIGDKNE